MPSSPVQPPSDALRRSQLDFHIVGIGASAGGLLAVRALLESLPSDSGMAYVVVLHLSPRHESTADAVLARATRMPVAQVTGSTPIEPDHVYVISPRSNLRLVDGMLLVEEARRPRGRAVAIDLFLRTLGDVHGEMAIGIVLSGAGADGAVGLARIKEQGGVTFAQLPQDAEYEEMPRNAIATGKVDFVLPVSDMAQQLMALRDHARRIRLPPTDGGAVRLTQEDVREESEQALREVLEILLFRTGHDFRNYKRATVLRRIERRLQVNGLADLPAYRDYLNGTREETAGLLDDLLISVTSFFRDREAFDALERDHIASLFAGEADGTSPRVWVPACATGEEAYSLAMLLSEHAAETGRPDAYQVFASDIDEPAIAVARHGRYPASILTDVPPSRIRRFFTRDGERFRIAKHIRERVLFAPHNLLRDPPFSRLDLISCRNLLIYLDREVQARVLEIFFFALKPGGLLFLGSSESAESASNLFDTVDKKQRIFRARAAARGVRYAHLVGSRPPEPGGPVGGPLLPSARGPTAAEIHQRVLENYAPPSVIVDRAHDIVHMSEHVGRFLQHPGGEPSHNLTALVHPALRRELRTVLFQAVHGDKSVEATRVRLERDGRPSFVTMVAKPFRDRESGADYVLVLFEEVEEALGEGDAQPDAGGRDEVVARLEDELDRVRLRLQNTIEHSEVSSEELKTSNEELQAINEELRSATEELETSREELQSVNEELITVNFELKTKVEETAKVNDDLHNFIAAVDIASVFVDSELRIKRYTPRAEDIFNIIPGDIGRCLLDITHRLDYPRLAEDARAAFQDLRQIEREVRSVDGRGYALRILPYRTAENRIDGAVLTFFATGALQRTYEQERTRGNALRQAAAATDHAIIVIDADGAITAWNAGAQAIFGWVEPEVLGKSLELLSPPEDVEYGLLRQEMEAALRDGSVNEDRWHLARDGTRLWCSGSLTAFRSGEGHGFVKVVRDATRLREADETARNRLVEAESERDEALAALRDDFVAVISHELRNPLNLISVNAEILAREPAVKASDNAAHAIGAIRGAIRGQGKIIDDLLDMSRIRTGKLTLAPVPVDLNGVVESIAEVVAADSASGGVAIRVNLWERPAVVNADPQRLDQIVWNLLSNAVKFTPEDGVVTLDVSAEVGYVKLAVSDTGRGIDPFFLPRIFELFGQAPGRALRGRSGLGIGLHLVRQLVERHGGRIRAASEGLGRGATFTVWLPQFDVACAKPPGGLPPPRRPRLTGVRILVVEDSADTAQALRVLLDLEGAGVALAGNGVEALEALRVAQFDIVLSDVGMPLMDGYALVRAMRADAGLADMKAVALTGFGRGGDVDEARQAGFDAHLTKPVDLDALVGKVRELLGLD